MVIYRIYWRFILYNSKGVSMMKKEHRVYLVSNDGAVFVFDSEPSQVVKDKFGLHGAPMTFEQRKLLDDWVEPPSQKEIKTKTTQSEMIAELNWVDLQLKYHSTGDVKRAVSSVELLNAYAIQCRDYVQNVDGVLTINPDMDKPVRPV